MMVEVELFYNLTEADLVLDPASINKEWSDVIDGLQFMLFTNRGDLTEFGRVIQSAAILYEKAAGTAAECMHTAIIWERG